MHARSLVPAAALALALALTPAGAANPPSVWIFGEQHDQPDQQAQVAAEVARLAERGELAAVVMEMAERGRSTQGLARDAIEAEARTALDWKGWPWAPYAAVVMNAVRAGVPVLGGNLPRTQIRSAMGDAALDARVSGEVRERLTVAVREGHCGALPPAQEPAMVRVQVGRDLSMAATVREALADGRGRRVLLLTGAQHAARDRGVPWHLLRAGGLGEADVRVVSFGPAAREAGLGVDEERPAVFTPRPDPCEGLAERLNRPAAASAP